MEVNTWGCAERLKVGLAEDGAPIELGHSRVMRSTVGALNFLWVMRRFQRGGPFRELQSHSEMISGGRTLEAEGE
jgi:hypothetical protein